MRGTPRVEAEGVRVTKGGGKGNMKKAQRERNTKKELTELGMTAKKKGRARERERDESKIDERKKSENEGRKEGRQRRGRKAVNMYERVSGGWRKKSKENSIKKASERKKNAT